MLLLYILHFHIEDLGLSISATIASALTSNDLHTGHLFELRHEFLIEVLDTSLDILQPFVDSFVIDGCTRTLVLVLSRRRIRQCCLCRISRHIKFDGLDLLLKLLHSVLQVLYTPKLILKSGIDLHLELFAYGAATAACWC